MMSSGDIFNVFFYANKCCEEEEIYVRLEVTQQDWQEWGWWEYVTEVLTFGENQ